MPADHRIEQSLWQSAKLSALDRGPSNDFTLQTKFEKTLRDCSLPAASQAKADCVRAAYQGRNYALAIAALIRLPDLALPVIREADPKFAPILEALQIWVSESSGSDWRLPEREGKRTRILTLLGPFEHVLQSEAVREILTTDEGKATVRRLSDIFKSPKHFAAFLNVLGPSIAEDSEQRVLPCAAVVRHPALLGATRPVFGSARDAFVFRTDCVYTLPPAPAVLRLGYPVELKFSTCEGTGRFGDYQQYRYELDLALLGATRSDSKLGRLHPAGISVLEISRARSELANYYQGYFKRSRAVAASMAGHAVGAIVGAVHDFCK